MLGKLFGRRPSDPRAGFADMMIERLTGDPRIDQVVKAPDAEFALQVRFVETGDDEPILFHLENAYRHWSEAGRDSQAKAAIETQWLESIASAGAPRKASVERLFPLLRHHGYLGEHEAAAMAALRKGEQLAADYDGPRVRPFSGDLIYILATESEIDVAMAHRSHLDELRIAEDDAWDRAFANMNQDRFSFVMEPANDAGLAALHFPDDAWLTPTLMGSSDLFDQFMERNAIETLLLALPSRAAVLFTDAALPHGQAMIEEAVKESLAHDHPQSNWVFRRERGAGSPEPLHFVEG